MKGKIVLVEDERRMAKAMQAILEQAGFAVQINAAGVSEAVNALEDGDDVDVGILDVNVADGEVYPVARLLRKRGIPFGFCTSMEPRTIRQEFSDVPMVRKPLDAAELIEFAARLQNDVSV